jgi:hypothetical protein
MTSHPRIEETTTILNRPGINNQPNVNQLALYQGDYLPGEFSSKSNFPSLQGFLRITGPGSPQ